jgi:hypothetical protein
MLHSSSCISGLSILLLIYKTKDDHQQNNHLLSEILQRKENTEGAIKNRQSRDTARAMQHLAQYTELRQTKNIPF